MKTRRILSTVVLSAYLFAQVASFAQFAYAYDILSVPDFIERTVTKNKIRNLLENSRNIDSYSAQWHVNVEDTSTHPSYDGEYVYTLPEPVYDENDPEYWQKYDEYLDSRTYVPNSSQVTDSYSFNSDVASTINFRNENNKQLAIDLKFNTMNLEDGVERYPDENGHFDGEVRMVDNTLFGVLRDYPNSDSDSSLAPYTNKWYSYSGEIITMINQIISQSKQVDLNSKISDAELDKLIEFLQSDEVNVNAREGSNENCISYSWSFNELKQVMRKLISIYNPEYLADYDSYQQEIESNRNEDFNITNFEVCADEDLNHVRVVNFDATYSSNYTYEYSGESYSNYGSIHLSQIATEYNTNVQVEKPAGAIDIRTVVPADEMKEFEEEFMSGFVRDFRYETGMDFNSTVNDECIDLGGDVFKDVTTSFDAYDSIKYAKEKNIVGGFSDGCFRPGKVLTRGQLMKIIVRSKFPAATIDACTRDSFKDVSKNNAFRKEICVAKENGIVGGFSDGTFQDNRQVSFVEVAKILGNTYKLELKPTENPDPFAKFVFALSEHKAIPSAVTCYSQKVTRGQFVQMVHRLNENITDRDSRDYDYVMNCNY